MKLDKNNCVKSNSMAVAVVEVAEVALDRRFAVEEYLEEAVVEVYQDPLSFLQEELRFLRQGVQFLLVLCQAKRKS